MARRRPRLEDLAEELVKTFQSRVEVLAANLTSEDDLSWVEDRLLGASVLECLVNAAGFGTRELFWEAPLKTQMSMHRLHVLAVTRLIHAALPGMVNRRKEWIVNISSVGALTPSPQNVSYCATKAWMNSFTEGLALELRANGSPVYVQALCPGLMLTEFHEAMGLNRHSIPNLGGWMSPEDVVAASLKGLEHGTLFVFPGRRLRLVAALLAAMPRPLRHALTLRRARLMG